MRIVSAAEMAAIDRKTIEEFGIPSCVLMDRAGRAVFDFIMKRCIRGNAGKEDCSSTCMHIRSASQKEVFTVICGPGGNGGDGFVIASCLHEAGFKVFCVSLADREKLKGSAALYAGVYEKLGGSITFWDGQKQQLDEFLNLSDFAVDAIFGTGLNSNLRGKAETAVTCLNDSVCSVIAVDLPSGINADTGAVLGCAVKCSAVVTVGLPKWGLYLEPGRSFAGYVEIADIGFPKICSKADDFEQNSLVDGALASRLFPVRRRDSHKGTFGTAWILGGSAQYFGAPLLAASSALRSGAGLSLLGSVAKVFSVLGGEAAELLRWELTENAYFDDGALAALRAFSAGGKKEAGFPAPSAVCLGPGMGRSSVSQEFVRYLWQDADFPLLADADALWHLSHLTDPGKHSACRVVTPHLGELSRLLDTSIAEISANLPAAAVECARKFNCVAVVKGSPTLVSDGRRTWMNTTGGPILAQGGSGDVLAGLITGLIAQGMSAFEAAVLGVFWHGAAADRYCAEVGDRGVTASEICAYLPHLNRELKAR